jgi:hypothetical protein
MKAQNASGKEATGGLGRGPAADLTGRPASEKETAARAAVQICVGRPLGDREWDRARSNLLEYVSTVRGWQERKSAHVPDLPKAA